MSDRDQEIELALARVNVRWTPQQTERALAGLHGKIRRRRRAAKVGAGAMVMALGVWAFGPRVADMYRTAAEARVERAATQPAERAPVTFSDGSKLTALDQQTRVSVLEAAPERIVAGVERGSVRFEVSHHPERVFRAQAGDVAVEALGTIFTVERLDQGVWVSVTRGRVRVEWPNGSRELAVGEADWFPPRASDSAVAAAATNDTRATAAEDIAAPAVEEAPARSATNDGSHPQRWKALAAQGKHAEAYAALGSLTPSQLRNPEELLMAADSARKSGHPSQAVPFYERVIMQFRRDSRAAVAAFTLGKVLMESLGNPAKAAQRFAEARSLAPNSPLAPDALAREVEAWSRAGQPDRARERAEEYTRLYPNRSSATVRQFGGLE